MSSLYRAIRRNVEMRYSITAASSDNLTMSIPTPITNLITICKRCSNRGWYLLPGTHDRKARRCVCGAKVNEAGEKQLRARSPR